MWGMAEMLSPGRGKATASRVPLRPRRMRRRPELRAVATSVALFVAVAWTIVFGVGIVLR